MVEELVLDLRRELKMLTLLLAGMQEKFLQLDLYEARHAERRSSVAINEQPGQRRRLVN